MMPPECRVCELGLRDAAADQFEQVQFQLTSEQHAAQASRPQGWVGQPEGLARFCKPHAAIARKYAALTEREAMEKIRAEAG